MPLIAIIVDLGPLNLRENLSFLGFTRQSFLPEVEKDSLRGGIFAKLRVENFTSNQIPCRG